MKFRSVLIITMIFISIQVYSQLKPFRFGFKVAPNIAWISPDSRDYKNEGAVAGFSWGFMADITLADNYFLKTGFTYDYLNGKLEFPYKLDSVSTGTMYRKYNLRYLEVPMTIKMRTNKFGKMVYFGEIGLGTAFKLRAKSQDEFLNANSGLISEWESDISDEVAFIKESLIVGAGTEYYLDESTSLLFELTFNNSLSDILTGENSQYPETQENGFLYYFQLYVGIIF